MNNSSANNHSTRGVLMLTLCAFIWGTAFIAQSVGGDYAEPLTFNCARSVLATVFLFGCCLLFDKTAGKRFTVLGSDDPVYKDRLIKGGITCGLFLSLACFFQQLAVGFLFLLRHLHRHFFRNSLKCTLAYLLQSLHLSQVHCF